MKIRVAVIFGGKSVEHEVSIISAIQAIANIDTEKYEVTPVYMTKQNDLYIGEEIGNIEAYKDIKALLQKSQKAFFMRDGDKVWLEEYTVKHFGKKKMIEIDIAFPIVHGTNVEDGTLQGYLKTLGLPFVGCDVTASAIGMDKYITKAVLKDNGIPVLDCLCFHSSELGDMDSIVGRIEERFGYPVIVKPVNLGSSVGITVAKDRDTLTTAIDDAFLYSGSILVERAIVNLREVNCAVLGDVSAAEASECEEPLHTSDILSYEDKYLSGSKSGASKGMASVARKIPADISEDLRIKIRDMAVKAFKAFKCSGVARIDFILDCDTNKVYFNEINTIPGSLAFYLWEPLGVSYKELLDKLLMGALKRAREEANLTYAFDTNILSQQVLAGGKTGGKAGKL